MWRVGGFLLCMDEGQWCAGVGGGNAGRYLLQSTVGWRRMAIWVNCNFLTAIAILTVNCSLFIVLTANADNGKLHSGLLAFFNVLSGLDLQLFLTFH